MTIDLGFLPDRLSNSEDFKRAWKFAVSSVLRHAKQDCDLSTSATRQQALQAATDTFLAARLLRDELDSGVFADIVALDAMANEYGLSCSDIQSVRKFLHLLMQHVLIASSDEQDRIPKKRSKSAPKTAAYFVGRLCCQFDLGKPTDYASASHEKESVAISLLRCLLIEGKEDHKPSLGKLRGQIKIAKQGYEDYRPKM